MAPDWPMVLPPVSMRFPPIFALTMVSAEASVSDASFAPVVVRLAVLKLLALLVSVIVPPVELAVSACAWIAPVWVSAPPLESVRLPPTVALETISADASVSEASSEPPVVRLAVPTVLAGLVRTIALCVVAAFNTAVWIAPVWLMPFAPDKVSVPPTLAPAIESADASVSEALCVPVVVTVATANVLPERVSVMSPSVLMASALA